MVFWRHSFRTETAQTCKTKWCPVVPGLWPRGQLGSGPGLHHGASSINLPDTAQRREPDLLGFISLDGFTLLEAESQKKTHLQIFIKYLAIFNWSHNAIYNGISGMFCACPVPTCRPGILPERCYRSPCTLDNKKHTHTHTRRCQKET